MAWGRRHDGAVEGGGVKGGREGGREGGGTGEGRDDRRLAKCADVSQRRLRAVIRLRVGATPSAEPRTDGEARHCRVHRFRTQPERADGMSKREEKSKKREKGRWNR